MDGIYRSYPCKRCVKTYWQNILASCLPDSPLSSPALPSSSSVSSGLAQSNSYASSPLSLFRLQEQFRQHMAATNNLVHYPSFDMSTPSSLPYLGMNVNMPSPLGSLPCQSYYQTLSQAQQVWNNPLLQAAPGNLPGSLNSKTTSIENLRLRAKQHAASLGLDTLPNWSLAARCTCLASRSGTTLQNGGLPTGGDLTTPPPDLSWTSKRTLCPPRIQNYLQNRSRTLSSLMSRLFALQML